MSRGRFITIEYAPIRGIRRTRARKTGERPTSQPGARPRPDARLRELQTRYCLSPEAAQVALEAQHRNRRSIWGAD
jgi:hypothetical protein